MVAVSPSRLYSQLSEDAAKAASAGAQHIIIVADIHHDLPSLCAGEFVLHAAKDMGYEQYYAELNPNQHKRYMGVLQESGRLGKQVSSRLGKPPENVYYNLATCDELDISVMASTVSYLADVDSVETYMHRLDVLNQSIIDSIHDNGRSGVLVVGALHVDVLKRELEQQGVVASVICPSPEKMRRMADASPDDPRSKLLCALLADEKALVVEHDAIAAHSPEEAISLAQRLSEEIKQLRRVSGDSVAEGIVRT